MWCITAVPRLREPYAYCALGWGQWWSASATFWSSGELALFDEESWQSSNWPWSCLSDRVMSLFWATLRSLLTGSHQKGSKSSQARNLSRIRILSGEISPAQNPNRVRSKRLLRMCMENLKAFSAPPGWSAASGRSHNVTGSNQKGLECAWKIPKSASVELPNRVTGGEPKPPISPPSLAKKRFPLVRTQINHILKRETMVHLSQSMK